jgi:hypothetical protein
MADAGRSEAVLYVLFLHVSLSNNTTLLLSTLLSTLLYTPQSSLLSTLPYTLLSTSLTTPTVAAVAVGTVNRYYWSSVVACTARGGERQAWYVYRSDKYTRVSICTQPEPFTAAIVSVMCLLTRSVVSPNSASSLHASHTTACRHHVSTTIIDVSSPTPTHNAAPQASGTVTMVTPNDVDD